MKLSFSKSKIGDIILCLVVIFLTIFKIIGWIDVPWWSILMIPVIVWIFVILFVVYVNYLVDKDQSVFRNKNGIFEQYDTVYDRGSAIRPHTPGILKFDKEEGWFIVYEDGFEWVLSDKKKVEHYNF